ncbi:hypothetical protein [Anaerococcus provencensis]|uniref:hypothetical protein n=1 Tax=Anaerococcus provencensis TaxID=938293 RepID=UPI0002D9CE1A|nr:hypothetical protein [Anaerococcus provencensis]
MKINKFFGALAFSLCLATVSDASAQELDENIIISEIDNKLEALPNFDKASAREIKEYEANKDLINFGQEYEDRLKLAENIELLKKADDASNDKIIEESTHILNADDMESIKTQSDKLSEIISLYNIKEKLSLTDSEKEDIDKQLTAYLDKGLLFESNTKDLDLFQKAILNSKSYELADDKTKDKYKEVIYDVKNKDFDQEAAYKILQDFLQTEDKLSFDGNLILTEEIAQNQKFNSSNDTSITQVNENEVIETTSIDSDNMESESSESDSAFLTNEKTKNKYSELTDDQKKELDLIDTDKNGQISESELESSENFTPNLDKSSWLYPFTEKALNEASQEGESSSQTSDSSNDETSSEEIETPKTVTIDNKSTKSPQLATETNKDDKKEEKEEFKESEAQPDKTNTNAGSVVKTGIKGLGTVAIILVIAIIAYYFMKKNSRDMRK